MQSEKMFILFKDDKAVRVTEIVMHREPRGAESAEITLGEVRLSILRRVMRGRIRRRGETGDFAPFKYPRTFSALRSKRGELLQEIARSEVEQRCERLRAAVFYGERGAFFFWEDGYV